MAEVASNGTEEDKANFVDNSLKRLENMHATLKLKANTHINTKFIHLLKSNGFGIMAIEKPIKVVSLRLTEWKTIYVKNRGKMLVIYHVRYKRIECFWGYWFPNCSTVYFKHVLLLISSSYNSSFSLFDGFLFTTSPEDLYFTFLTNFVLISQSYRIERCIQIKLVIKKIYLLISSTDFNVCPFENLE